MKERGSREVTVVLTNRGLKQLLYSGLKLKRSTSIYGLALEEAAVITIVGHSDAQAENIKHLCRRFGFVILEDDSE